MNTPTSPALLDSTATTEVLLVADKLYSSDGLESRLWERRGFLKRLVRSDSAG
ncbi:MAG: hypothetical protein ABI896_10730 [Actinomycetota bacterium]